LCGSGVTSSMEVIRRPAPCIAEIADSRPAPGPLTLISTSRTPFRIAVLAQFCAACWAANGVLFREPLKPTLPAEAVQIVSPSTSVTVINVLLKVALMCTIARTMFFLTLRFVLLAICVSYPMLGSVLRTYRFSFTPFFPATVLRGPLRLRALLCVCCPRTGRPLRCRMPR